MNYQQAAIPLLVAEKTGMYSITPEAEQIISSIKTPIAVVSVAGLYRTGKSYLLNRMLLNRSNGFGVGSTINACTKGLWMWGSPIKTRTQDGQPLTLLIIDTEGLGATDQDDTHDNKIFSLAILLSTCFIYNSTGSIDETAIQSLNLVLNLSQTIYQQSSSTKMDTKQLPSFVWVVRDFSLQLIDSKGNHITSKEYLENALALQKNTGKDAEEKNKVRKFITECFPSRDCCTMIRPCSGDMELRQLDRLPLESLRPQFVEQVMGLRKRIFGRLQPKRINNNIVDGDAYFKIIKTYVEAINNGAVPNIQSAWEYICAEKSQKLLNESQDLYLRGIKDEVQYRIPCLNTQIKGALQNVKRNSLNHFAQGIWGEKNDEIKLELEHRIHTKEQSIYSQNQKQSVSAAQNVVTKEFQPINKKLKSGLYMTFTEFEHDIKSFYAYLMEHHRKYQSCEMVYMQFVNKRILEGSQFFFKNLEQQLNALKETKFEAQSKNQRQIQELKAQYNRYKLQTDELVSKTQREKVEADFNLQQTKNQLSTLQSQRQQLDFQKDSKINLLVTQVESLTRQLKSKELDLETKVREGMRQDCLKNAEWQKQKALNQQQSKFSKQRIETLERKQKQMQQQIVSIKSDLESRIREIASRGDDKNKSLVQQLAEKSDKLFEATGLIKKLQEDLKSLEDLSDSKERKLRSEILDLQTSLEGFKNNDVVEKNRLMTTNMNQKREILQSLDDEKEKNRVLEIQLKEANEHLKHNKVSFERDQAIHSQKIQFQQIQLKQLKTKYSQLQATHQNALLNCENASKQKLNEIQNSIMFDLKSSHQRQIREIEAQFESKVRFTRNQVENYKRKKQELELALQLLTKKNQDKQCQYKQSIRQLEEMCQRIQVQKMNSEQGTAHFKREIQIHYQTKIKRLEHQLENLRDQSRTELNEAHQQSQVTVRELKSYYQLERQRLDRKIQEQKQKSEIKVRKNASQYEQRLTEERVQFEEEIASCKNSMNHIEQSYKQRISNLQYQHDILVQKLSSELSDWKIQFEKQNSLSQQQLDYANKRVQTLLKQKENIQQRSEQKIRNIQIQLQQEMRVSIQKVNEQKILLEQKYQKLKISLRDSEQNIHKLNIDFEKQRTVMKSREASLQARLAEIEEKSRLKIKLKEDELQKTLEAHEIQRHTLMSEVQRLKFETNKLQDQKAKMKSIHEAEKTLHLNKLNFVEQQSKRYKNECDDIIVKFETTVKHLTKEREKINNEKALAINQIAISLKSQSERQIEGLKNNHVKIVRDLEDKIQRMQTEKKNTADKMMNMEVRLANQSSLVENDKKSRLEVDKVKRQYENRIYELESKIAQLKKQVLYYESVSSTSKKNTTDFDDRVEVSGIKKSNLQIGSALSNKGIPSSNIPSYQPRESENRKQKLSAVSPAVSGASLLGNIGNVSNMSNLSNFSHISKKSVYPKDKLIDFGQFGSPFNSKNRN